MRTVEELLARDEITDVLYRYCRGVDRMDAELTRSCWHPDGTADYGPLYRGDADGLIAWMWPVHEGMAAHSHQVTNRTIVVDGDRARSETYVMVGLRTAGDDPVDIISRARYLDTWSRREGTWAIDHRVLVDDLTSYHAPLAIDLGTAVAVDPDGPQAQASRDRADPSYRHLAG